jgi:cation transport ATPase
MNTKPNPIKNLLTQRKFWMALLGFIAATIMLATNQIDPNAWLNSTMLLVTLVITGNVAEDYATKRTTR